MNACQYFLKDFGLFIVLSTFTLEFAASHQSGQFGEKTNPPSAIQAIGTVEVLQLIQRKDVVLIDARDEILFDKMHIRDAINVPEAKLGEYFAKGSNPRNTNIIVYGTRSEAVIEQKIRGPILFGEKNVMRYVGGLPEWLSCNLPTQGSL